MEEQKTDIEIRQTKAKTINGKSEVIGSKTITPQQATNNLLAAKKILNQKICEKFNTDKNLNAHKL